MLGCSFVNLLHSLGDMPLISLPRFLLNSKGKQEQTKYNAEQNQDINVSFVPNGSFPKNQYFHVLLGPLQCAKF